MTQLDTSHKIDILEDEIYELNTSLLKLLLKDKTTKGNILWCTTDYETYGHEYNERMPMQVELITGDLSRVIQPRAAKSREVQRNRIKNHAEVFTPSWVFNEQNITIVSEKIMKMEQQKDRNFANARDIRNYFEQIIARQALKVSELHNPIDSEILEITAADV